MEKQAYWEDAIIGDERISPSRTVTEADIVNFAGISGSWDPEHVDAEYAKQSPFGERIAHGLLTLSIAEGLRAKNIWYNGDSFRGKTLIAFLGLNNLMYKQAVKIGDTIRCASKIIDKRETSKPERGIIIFEEKILNQRDEVTAQWERTCLYFRRPKEN